MRAIDIDFDVHKEIEAARRSFEETPNDVLRRLLKIGGDAPINNSPAPLGKPWTGKGVTLPHGTLLRMDYNGHRYNGKINNGRWECEGGVYTSPSDAAGGVGLTKSGKQTSLNGWQYWYVQQPGETRWRLAASLRK